MKHHGSMGLIFSFFGPPGSGKGTLAEQCARKLGYSVLSTGNLCRKHIASGTKFGKDLEIYLSAGKLVPDQLIIEMVKEWLVEKIALGKPIILDGFPRTEEQSQAIINFLQQEYPLITFKVIVFEIADEVVVKRVVEGRMVCGNRDCQAGFSGVVPPKKDCICDYCGCSLEKRADDTTETMLKRLHEFAGYKSQVLRAYNGLNVTVEKVDPVKYGPVELFNKFYAMVQSN